MSVKGQGNRINECFRLSENENYEIEGKIMTINGNGVMCDCFESLSQFNRLDITKIIIEENVTRIGSACFSQFEQVTEITIGKSVEEIRKSTFSGLNIESIEIPANVERIESKAFEKCSKLKSVSIPDDSQLSEMEDRAFRDCISLTSFFIPKQLKSFNRKILEGCDSLETITVHPENSEYFVENNMSMTKDKKKVVYYPPGREESHLSIPQNVEIIGEKSFLQSQFESI